jgi:hypothetical protein
MAEEQRAAQQLYSEQKIAQILDALIDAARQVAHARRILDMYQDTYRPEQKRPPMPEGNVFADTHSLMEYVNALASYDPELNYVVIEQTNAENRLAEQEGKVRAILPPGSIVLHTYRMKQQRPGEHGGKYQITNHTDGKIRISKIDD